MSDYRGHIAAGAVSYAVLAFIVVVVVPPVAGFSSQAFVQRWWEIPVQLLVAVLAALWPDVDIASQGRKLFYRLFLVLDLYLVASRQWHAAAFLGLFAILPGLGKHRGWTHRPWAALLAPLPIIVAPLFLGPGGTFTHTPDYSHLRPGLPYYVASVVGYISHLAADGVLGRGIGAIMNAALWPIRALWKASETENHHRGLSRS